MTLVNWDWVIIAIEMYLHHSQAIGRRWHAVNTTPWLRVQAPINGLPQVLIRLANWGWVMYLVETH